MLVAILVRQVVSTKSRSNVTKMLSRGVSSRRHDRKTLYLQTDLHAIWGEVVDLGEASSLLLFMLNRSHTHLANYERNVVRHPSVFARPNDSLSMRPHQAINNQIDWLLLYPLLQGAQKRDQKHLLQLFLFMPCFARRARLGRCFLLGFRHILR